MNTRLTTALSVALLSTVAVVGCKKKEEPAPQPVVTAPTPAPAPAPMAATASVASVDLGSAVGADSKITTATTTFKPKDTVYASIATSTSDSAATVPGKLSAKWTMDKNGTAALVNEESKDLSFKGPGVYNFFIKKPDGFPVGKYKVEVSLNGTVVQTKDFEVK